MAESLIDPGAAPAVEEAEGSPGRHEWSARWPGNPSARDIRLPRVERTRMRSLVGVIEDEIIPRLVLNDRARLQSGTAEGTSAAAPNVECVAEFVALLLVDDIEAASRYIDAARVRGVSLSSIYLELLAPAAHVLGKLWEEDRCSFATVTVALCRLHELLRGLSAAHPRESEASPAGRRVLLVPSPGEQHTFGLVMVADFFRRTGWDVWSETPRTTEELVGLVRQEWFTIIGLSVGCDVRLEGVASLIHELRKASRNRAVGVMVGGAVFTQRPELALLVGADATGRDGRHAAMQAENLVRMFARRS